MLSEFVSLILLIPIDCAVSHVILYFFLFAIADTKIRWKSMGKMLLFVVPVDSVIAYFSFMHMSSNVLVSYTVTSVTTILINTAAVSRGLKWNPLKAFSALCIAASFQVGVSTMLSTAISEQYLVNLKGAAQYIFWMCLVLPAAVICLCNMMMKLKFGRRLRFLLDDRRSLPFTAAAALGLEVLVEILFTMQEQLEDNFNLIYILSILILLVLIICLFIYISAKGERDSKIRIQEAMLLEQRHYMENLESMQQEMRAFRHDYKNMLSGMSLYAEEGNTREIRKALQKMEADFDNKVGENIRQAGQLGNIQVPELKSLVLSKLSRMKRKHIACNLEVLYPVTRIDMDVMDLNRCLGILIDNAIEAVENTDTPMIDLIITKQDTELTFIVQNQWNGELALHNIWKEGYSTKGDGRGLGLSSYKRILEKYSNAFPSTSWKNNLFKQEIKLVSGN